MKKIKQEMIKMIVSVNNSVYHPVRTPRGSVPAIVVIGRDIETKKRILYQNSVKPKFYVEEWVLKGIDKVSLRQLGVCKTSYSQMVSLNNRLVRELELKHPLKVADTVRYLHKVHRARTFEADLAKISGLPLKWLIDNEVFSGYEVIDGEVKACDAPHLIRYWMLDFECLTKLRESVNPKRNEPIIMASIYDNFKNNLITLHTHPDDFVELSDDHTVVKLKDEKELLEGLFSLLDSDNPDMITAHNLYRYDLVKWVNRIMRCGLNLNRLSPKPFRSVDIKRGITIKGRIMFDLMRAFMFYTSKEFREYSLEFIIEREKLPFPKIPFDRPMSELWDDTADISFDNMSDEMKEYFSRFGITKDIFRPSYVILLRNYLDVKTLQAYENKHGLIKFFDDIRITSGCLFNDIFMKYKIFDSTLLRFCHGKTVLPTGKTYSKSGGFTGGLVLEPVPGKYSNVVCIDFEREYPSIIRSLNISPDTFIAECSTDVDEFVKLHLKKNHRVIHSEDAAYAFKNIPKGLMVKVVDRYWKQRDDFEEQSLAAAKSGDKVAEKIAKNKAFQTKQILNATFGVMSFSGFRLYSRPCSAGITFAARIGAKKAIEFLQLLGYNVIYGDTDSIFFISDEPMESLQELVEQLNRHLGEFTTSEWNARTNPFIMSIKRRYKTFIVLTKKRYCGKYYYDEKRGFDTDYEWKGVEKVRSDSSEVERDMQEKILTMSMDNKEDSEIEKYWINLLIKVKHREFNPYQVSYPTKIRAILEMRNHVVTALGYTKNMPAHIKSSIYSNMFLDTDFRTGDKPKRLPIQVKLLRSKLYPKEFVIRVPGGKSKSYKLNGISVDKHFGIPPEFEEAINWSKIESRLIKKAEAIFTTCKINIAGLQRKIG